jgi:hypothetical protein
MSGRCFRVGPGYVLDITGEYGGIRLLGDLRMEFLNLKSSFQEDRNANGEPALFPWFCWATSYGADLGPPK